MIKTPIQETFDSTTVGTVPHAEMQDLGTDLQVTVSFSLLFQGRRASELDINAVEAGVLRSLEEIFCDRNSRFDFSYFLL